MVAHDADMYATPSFDGPACGAREQLGKRNEFNLVQQINAKNSSGVSEDQLRDWNETFDHFDRDHNQVLDYVEFKSCLRGVGAAPRPRLATLADPRVLTPPQRRAVLDGRRPGFDLPVVADGVREPEFDNIIAFCDPQNTGVVTRHAFIAFMTQKRSEKVQSASEILNAFAMIAEDKPYVTEEQLRCVWRSPGPRPGPRAGRP